MAVSQASTPDVAPHRDSSSTIDPTKNVLDLVQAQARFQEKIDGLALTARLAEDGWIVKYFEALAVAEQRRLNDLAELKKDYDKAISETQTGQMKTTSDLVSTQLDKVTTSLSDTINKTADNIAAMLATQDKRIAAVEQFRYETGGRSSVSDPAMSQIAADLKALMSKADGGSGEKRGHDASAAWLIAVASLAFSLIIGIGGIVAAALHVAH